MQHRNQEPVVQRMHVRGARARLSLRGQLRSQSLQRLGARPQRDGAVGVDPVLPVPGARIWDGLRPERQRPGVGGLLRRDDRRGRSLPLARRCVGKRGRVLAMQRHQRRRPPDHPRRCRFPVLRRSSVVDHRVQAMAANQSSTTDTPSHVACTASVRLPSASTSFSVPDGDLATRASVPSASQRASATSS